MGGRVEAGQGGRSHQRREVKQQLLPSESPTQERAMAVNKCVKYLLFLFNLLFWISGCIILGVSIYLKVSNEGNEEVTTCLSTASLRPQLTNEALPGIDLMIAIGAIIMLLGFLGCCGAIRENRCLLLIFFISLLIIFILLLAAGILGAVEEQKVKDWMKERLEKFTPLSKQPQNVKDDLEKLQVQLKCCGLVNGKSDWDKIPDSCRCNATETVTCQSTYNETPCIKQIITLMEDNLEIFGMVFSMMLYCQIGRKDGATTA
ncbi:unnamed protein product [Menidia menidia]|uniref:Tetraspanin n=1 Tax=Menidia menidia TaxID=238744 RepID=A0A8S4B2C8_9TELE|nr:unnamed protein product [Menidia menidia]